MAKLLDHYSEFRRSMQTCKYCGWHGSGGMMKNGDCFGDGIEKHCPKCGQKHTFAQFCAVVSDDAPDDWPSKIRPVRD